MGKVGGGEHKAPEVLVFSRNPGASRAYTYTELFVPRRDGDVAAEHRILLVSTYRESRWPDRCAEIMESNPAFGLRA